MANTDKNIVITPNTGSSTDDPKVVFSGADASTAAQDITLYAYPDNSGTLSFEGSSGQLFSITNDLTGVIFSVNDISGIPSLEVNADGTVSIAEFDGDVGIGTSSPSAQLHVIADSATTNADIPVLRITATSTGTPLAGIGPSIEFESETAAGSPGNLEIGGVIALEATDVTSTSEDFDLVFSTMAAGAAAAERMRIDSTGDVSATSFTGSGASLTSLTAANIAAGNLNSGVLLVAAQSATSSAFKVPFLNTTGTATGNYALLHDSTANFTYNPSTNTLAAGTFSGNLTMDSVALTTVQTSGEGFADNDTSIMTSAAIDDRILSYGYSTTTGTVTSVGITAGILIDVTGSPVTTSGNITVDVDLSEATEAVFAPATDYVLFLDGGVTGTAAKEAWTDFATAIAGTGITATSGVLSADVPTTITVADESADTTCFPLFVTAATGDLAPKSGTNLTFNSAIGDLQTTSINLTGTGTRATASLQLESTSPAIYIQETGATADEGNWELKADADTFALATASDADTAGENVFVVARTGTTVATTTFNGTLAADNLSGTNTGDEPAASDTVAGIVELATIAETNTGTSTTLAVTPDGLDGWTGSAQVTTLGTIATGVWNGTALTAAYVPNHDSLNGFVANEHLDWTTDTGSVIVPDNLNTDLSYAGVSTVTPQYNYVGYDRFSGGIDNDLILDEGIFGLASGDTNGPGNGTFNSMIVLRNSSDVRTQIVFPRQASEAPAWRGYASSTFTSWHYAGWTTTEANASLSLYPRKAENATITGNWKFDIDTIGDFIIDRQSTTGASGMAFHNDDGVKGYIGYGDEEAFKLWDSVTAVLFQVTNTGSILMEQKANADADQTDRGQVWVKNDAPNNLYFTDDTGTDYALTGPESPSAASATVQTTTATQTEILAYAVASGTSVGFEALIMGRQDATGDTVLEKIRGIISNEAGTTALIDTPGVDRHESAGATTWAVTVAADDTSDELTFDVTGEASHTIDWKIKLEVIVI